MARRVPVGALTPWRAFGAQVQAPRGASRRHCGAQSRTSAGAPALQGSTDGARESFAACVGVLHRLVRLLLTRRRPARGMGEHRRVLRALPGRGSAKAPYGAHPSHRVALVSTPLAGTIWAAGHSPPVPERAQLLLTLGHLQGAGSGLEQRISLGSATCKLQVVAWSSVRVRKRFSVALEAWAAPWGGPDPWIALRAPPTARRPYVWAFIFAFISFELLRMLYEECGPPVGRHP